MRLLHPRSLTARHNKGNVAEFSCGSTISAQKPDSANTHTARHLQRLDDIRGATGCRDAEKYITLSAKPGQRARKDIIKAIIIAASRQRGGVKRKRDGRP